VLAVRLGHDTETPWERRPPATRGDTASATALVRRLYGLCTTFVRPHLAQALVLVAPVAEGSHLRREAGCSAAASARSFHDSEGVWDLSWKVLMYVYHIYHIYRYIYIYHTYHHVCISCIGAACRGTQFPVLMHKVCLCRGGSIYMMHTLCRVHVS
jgi:hypothetical protein